MTTRGRSLLALSVSMLVFGRISGLRELVMAGAAFALMLAVGAVLVWLRGGDLEIARRIAPDRTIVGQPVRVELTVQARGRSGFGPLLLADRIPSGIGSTPRLALPGSGRARRRAVAYRLSPRMRGRYGIGPTEVTHTDPLGAIQRRRRVGSSTPLIVYPSYEEVSSIPRGTRRVGIVRHSPFVGIGEEFFAIRAYVQGDDLRQIHWPTSMKTGDLMIRQNELLAEPRALIVLDTAAAKHRGRGARSSLEAAVSACASLGVLASRRRMRLEVVTTDGPLLRMRNPSRDDLLEALAGVRASRQTSLAPALTRTRGDRPAFVAVITPDLRREESTAIALRAHGASAGAIVWVDASTFDTSGKRRVRTPALPTYAFPVIPLRAGDGFRHAWETGIADVAVAR